HAMRQQHRYARGNGRRRPHQAPTILLLPAKPQQADTRSQGEPGPAPGGVGEWTSSEADTGSRNQYSRRNHDGASVTQVEIDRHPLAEAGRKMAQNHE